MIAVTQPPLRQQPTVARARLQAMTPIAASWRSRSCSAVAQEADGIRPTGSLSAMAALVRTPVLPEAALEGRSPPF